MRLAVGRREAVPAQHGAVGGQLRRRRRRRWRARARTPPRRIRPTGRRATCRRAGSGRRGSATLGLRVASTSRPCCAGATNSWPRAVRTTRSPVGREVRGGDPVKRRLDPALAHVVEVGDQSDRHDAIGVGGDVVDADVGAELVRDAPVGQRRATEPRSRRGACAASGPPPRQRHRPQVHRAVAVAEEVHAAVPEHRPLAGAGESRRSAATASAAPAREVATAAARCRPCSAACGCPGRAAA